MGRTQEEINSVNDALQMHHKNNPNEWRIKASKDKEYRKKRFQAIRRAPENWDITKSTADAHAHVDESYRKKYQTLFPNKKPKPRKQRR